MATTTKGETVRIPFNTSGADGASITIATNGTPKAYVNGSTTEITTGVTLTEDQDAITGRHFIVVDTTGSGFTIGSDVDVAIDANTIDGKTVNAWVGKFSLNKENGADAGCWTGASGCGGDDHVAGVGQRDERSVQGWDCDHRVRHGRRPVAIDYGLRRLDQGGDDRPELGDDAGHDVRTCRDRNRAVAGDRVARCEYQDRRRHDADRARLGRVGPALQRYGHGPVGFHQRRRQIQPGANLGDGPDGNGGPDRRRVPPILQHRQSDVDDEHHYGGDDREWVGVECDYGRRDQYGRHHERQVCRGAIDATAIATDTITAAKLAADAGAEIADAVWDEVLSGHDGGYGGQGADRLRAPPAIRGRRIWCPDTRARMAGNILNAVKAKTDQLAFSTANQVDAQVKSMATDTLTSGAVAASAVTESVIRFGDGQRALDRTVRPDGDQGRGRYRSRGDSGSRRHGKSRRSRRRRIRSRLR